MADIDQSVGGQFTQRWKEIVSGIYGRMVAAVLHVGNTAVSNDAPVPASVKDSALPSGAATETTLEAVRVAAVAIETATEILDNIVAGSEAQVDVVSSALPTGAATEAKQDSIVSALGSPLQAGGTVTSNQGTAGAAAWPVKDAGPNWTPVWGLAGVRFTSADASGAETPVTDAPTGGQKIVVTDLIVSVDTTMRVDFSEEDAAGVVLSVYMAANSTVQITPRGKLKLATADKQLMVQTSVAGNIAVLACYFSEA